jgi:hypothetical protein
LASGKHRVADCYGAALLVVSVLTLEELHGALVLLGCGSAGESAEIAPAAGSWINFS